MREYRGIRLADECKLYRVNGKFAKGAKRSLDNFIDKLEVNSHKLLGEYLNNNEKVLIDFECGHESHWIEPKSYKNGQGCPICGRDKASRVLRERGEESLLLLIRSNGHELLSEYEGDGKKVLIDLKCGHEPSWIKPNHYKNGVRCFDCKYVSMGKKLSEQAKEEFPTIVKSNGHELMSEYINAHTYVLINFNCGHPLHWVKPSNYKASNSGCPICNTSKGERIIVEWVSAHSLEYIHHYIFEDFKEVEYDIFLPHDNLIIEIHGSQHYEEVDSGDGRSRGLEYEQWNDARKEKFVRSKGINYMVVDYREHDPQLTLERFIKQYEEFKYKVLTQKCGNDILK